MGARVWNLAFNVKTEESFREIKNHCFLSELKGTISVVATIVELMEFKRIFTIAPLYHKL